MRTETEIRERIVVNKAYMSDYREFIGKKCIDSNLEAIHKKARDILTLVEETKILNWVLEKEETDAKKD